MKRLVISLMVLVVAFAGISIAEQKGQQHDPNPQKDPDVQRGYDEHQKRYKEEQEKQERKEKGEIKDRYEIKESEGTVKHSGGGDECPKPCLPPD